MRPLIASIDLAALNHNLAQMRKAAPGVRMLAVIKADGYGHGLSAVGRALEAQADGLAVACLEEAAVLRAAGCSGRIVLLEGFFHPEELPHIVELGLECVIHDMRQAQQLIAFSPIRPLPIWIKINTGMNRLGISSHQFPALWQLLQTHPHHAYPLRLMTHLACADEIDNPFTPEQCVLFERTVNGLQAERAIANTAGVLGWPQTHQDWARPGIGLYGVSPFSGEYGAQRRLRPVMRLRSAMIRINHCQVGDQVGYGITWRCEQAMPIGVIAVGYGDGYPRHAPAGTPVWINGQCVPVVGRVSMDMLTVDLRTAPNTQVGDEVELWGPNLPVETIAAHAKTIAYELLTGVTPRVRREYQGQP